MDLDLIAYKLPDGLWAFDHPHNDTVKELLCNGTEKVIDTHYYFLTGCEAVPGNEMKIHLTNETPDDVDDYDTSLTFIKWDEEGSTYLDEVMCDNVWLCNWLQGYFGEIPDKLYVRVDTVNKGLNSFVKATGMTKLLYRK
jgi:hypothetical protein